MPDVSGIALSLNDLIPQLRGSFVLGMQLTAAVFVLLGIISFLRRTL